MTQDELKEYKKKISNLTVNEKKMREIHQMRLAKGEIQGPVTGYPSIDKPWLKNYKEEDLSIESPKMSLFDQFALYSKDYINDIAYTYIPKDNLEINLSYKKVIEDVRRIAKSIVAQNPKKDEIIMAILPNCPEAKELFFACSKIGVIIYPISPLMPPSTLDRVFSEYNIKDVFLFSGFNDKYGEVLSKYADKVDNIVQLDATESISPVLLKIGEIMDKVKGTYSAPPRLNLPNCIDYKAFINKSKKVSDKVLDSYYEYDENRPVTIIGTSGTTGIPKSVPISSKSILTLIDEHKAGIADFKHGDRYLEIMNNSIAYGCLSAMLASLWGVRTYFRPGYTFDLYDDIKKYNINEIVAGVLHAEELLKHLQKGENVDGMKTWVSGGSTFYKSTEGMINNIGEGFTEDGKVDDRIIVRQGYGATENCGVVTFQKTGAYKFGSVGIPLVKENVGIFEPHTDNELKYNEEGEICISADSVMTGYVNNPEDTAKALVTHSDGTVWLHLNDLGYMDEDGNVFFKDRISNLFQRAGNNVHPEKINDFLKTIDIIDNCVTGGVVHPAEQKVPVSFIKLKDPNMDLEKAEDIILDLCYKNLEEQAIPYDIRFVDNIPINNGGKPDFDYLVKQLNVNFENQGRSKKKALNNIKVLKD